MLVDALAGKYIFRIFHNKVILHLVSTHLLGNSCDSFARGISGRPDFGESTVPGLSPCTRTGGGYRRESGTRSPTARTVAEGRWSVGLRWRRSVGVGKAEPRNSRGPRLPPWLAPSAACRLGGGGTRTLHTDKHIKTMQCNLIWLYQIPTLPVHIGSDDVNHVTGVPILPSKHPHWFWEKLKRYSPSVLTGYMAGFLMWRKE